MAITLRSNLQLAPPCRTLPGLARLLPSRCRTVGSPRLPSPTAPLPLPSHLGSPGAIRDPFPRPWSHPPQNPALGPPGVTPTEAPLATQGHVQSGLEHLQGWRQLSCSHLRPLLPSFATRRRLESPPGCETQAQTPTSPGGMRTNWAALRGCLWLSSRKRSSRRKGMKAHSAPFPPCRWDAAAQASPPNREGAEGSRLPAPAPAHSIASLPSPRQTPCSSAPGGLCPGRGR